MAAFHPLLPLGNGTAAANIPSYSDGQATTSTPSICLVAICGTRTLKGSILVTLACVAPICGTLTFTGQSCSAPI